MLMTPIKTIELKDQATNGTHINVNVHISDEGDLVTDGCDSGKAPEKVFGDWDIEYFTTVKKEYKDTVLLLLIKEKFQDDFAFRSWLNVNGIPNTFINW